MSTRFTIAHGVAAAAVLALHSGAAAADAARTFSAGDYEVRAVTVVDGLEHPWSMAFLPDGAVLVTERPGRLRIVRDGRLAPEPLSGVPEVVASGQGGLLDVVLHPDFEANSLVYLSYAAQGPGGATTAIARGRFDGEALVDTSTIFMAEAEGATGRHFGGRMVFDPDGYLYLTIGDRGEMDRAQDTGDHAGTTLRLRDDGSVPEQNPFVDDEAALPEIFTFGNRNGQGLAVHPDTGAVWQHEHGPRGGDEINVLRAGLNYGWPEVTYGIGYSGGQIAESATGPGFEPPLKHWTPSIAPSGMAFYTGDVFPVWQGDIFVGALAGQHLARVSFDGTQEVGEEQMMTDFGWRIRAVTQGPDGHLYLLVDAADAPMVRLERADP
ncbi:PQQ-dependent sugar dehydrogenase [Fodinicurvata sp. EGI_FJ10296]|uniref:PQQ-dependent sugar dehydrogenase n=1 Tax=Fodinicurvata sp. EGI_FJ10296 TaxID=3231908 RepID=UPI0034570226